MSICNKCGFESEENKEFQLENETIFLCNICKIFAPENKKIKEYISEKIPSQYLESFRMFLKNKADSMEIKAKSGNIMSRAAFGYKIEDKQLVVDEEKKLIVQKIFLDFLNEDISLNNLSKRYNFSLNGIKKILKNFTYLGKIKFNGQIIPGNHLPIISHEMFNKVQKKLESI